MKIASQWGEAINQAVAAAVPNAEIIAVEQGNIPCLSHGIDALLAAPMRNAAGDVPESPPEGWSFGLRWVQLLSVGLDSYPAWLFDGPVVTSARGTSAVAMAEFAMMLILTDVKKTNSLWASSPDDWALRELNMMQDATLGVAGFGAVAEKLAQRALAFGMRVIATRRSSARLEYQGVERASGLAELFERSDHLVLTMPSTPETIHCVNHAVLAHANPDLHLINLARGTLVDNKALLAALNSGKIRLASLDVTDPEPLPPGHSFYRHPKVRLTPHTSAATASTVLNLAALVASNLEKLRRGEPLESVVSLGRGY